MQNKKKEEEELEKTSSIYKDVGPYLGIGLQLAVTVAAFVFLGIWLDSKFGKEPLFTLIFSFLGCAVGLYNFIRIIIDLGKRSQK